VDARLKDIAHLLGLSISTVSKALRRYPGVSRQTMERVDKAARQMGFSADHFAKRLRQTKSPRPRVTLADIAKKAGCSKMTVSMALRHHPDLAAATLKRIQAMAGQMGYVPNSNASLLAYRRKLRRSPAFHSSLALIIGHRDYNPLVSLPYPTPQMHQAIRKRARDLGFSIDFFWLHDPETRNRLPEILKARAIQGLILHSLDDLDFEIFRVDWNRFSVVELSVHPESARFHYSFTNIYHPIWQVSSWACGLGYRRPALIMRTGPNQKFSKRISAAIRESCYDHGIELLRHEWPVPTKNPEPIFHFLDRYRPDLIFTWESQLADWLKGTSWRLPDDFSLIDLFLDTSTRQEAGLAWDFDAIAVAAVDMLVAQLQHNERGVPRQPHGLFAPLFWKNGYSLRIPEGMLSAPSVTTADEQPTR
jgi:LacI family transcriptional regulator